VKLKIWQVGEPVLRVGARALTREEVVDGNLPSLLERMTTTLRDAPGVGLAAPQIGLSLQLAIIEDRAEYVAKLSPEEAAAKERIPVPWHVIINPVLTLEPGDPAEFYEGCLSLPGFAAWVPRARKVHVRCWNERAEEIEISAEGWYARILQHEIDHLNGTMYIDRMQSRTFTTQDNLSRAMRGSLQS